ncbi:helix-turn-helix domain-containing protein [Paracoccus sp. pheM1]|nr:helix-turn-helix domain-containing protein [Paracoccus sp. pheM1]
MILAPISHSPCNVRSPPQSKSPARRYNLHHPVLEGAVRLMSSHIADPLPADQLAELSGCSLRQLQRCFSDHFGLSVMEFYRRLRLEKADELLRHSALPIAEITAITGFATMQHFSRCFAQAFGVPPGQRRLQGLGAPGSEAVSGKRAWRPPIAGARESVRCPGYCPVPTGSDDRNRNSTPASSS